MDLTLESLNLPNDPKDNIFLKICFVCQAPSKPGFNHLKNYGAVVCFSCRAFWRRCYQNATSSPKFVCRNKARGCSVDGFDSFCFIRATTRRNCKKCRHDRCLRAGMNPTAVLSDDQKKQRFKKLFKKRQKILDREAKLKRNSKTLGASNKRKPGSGSSTNSEPHPLPSTRLRARSHKAPEEMPTPTKVTLDEIEKQFSEAQNQTRRFFSIEEHLWSMQSLGMKEVTLTKEDILYFMDRLSAEFKQFASSHRKFESGSNHDFVNDLETSASLYVQLCMARYLMVNKVQEKQDAKQFTKKSWMTSFMQKQFLEEFSKKTNIFKPSADLDLYAKLIVKLKGLPELSSSTKFAVIAFSLMDPDVVRQQFRSAEEFRDLASLVEVLKSMAFFFSENIFQ